MTDPFVHLHVHSEFSLLDGAAKVEPLVKAAAADGQPALAITDHGVCYGLIDFYKACKKYDIKPILGIEAYMARHSVADRPKKGKSSKSGDEGEDSAGQKLFHHLTVLAETNTGYQNLIKLSSDAYLKGYYRKPRVDWDILSEHAAGLIATSGCLGGVVLQELLHDNFDEALASAARLQDIFGSDNFFMEIQDHGIPEQIRTNPQLIDIGSRIGAPIVGTNDLHYVNHSDAIAHDALLCQPAGTEVLMADGSIVKIEDIEIGDSVKAWDGSERRGQIKDGVVSLTGSYYHIGDIVRVAASDSNSSYTSDHICIARLDSDLTDGKYVTYMMAKGGSYRIGHTQWRRDRQKARPGGGMLGPVCRVDEQLADAIWILDVHATEHEAREQELWISYQYGIPTWSYSKIKHGAPRAPYYASLWNRAGDLTCKALACLQDFGRDIKYPFYDRADGAKPSQRRPQAIRACNLLDGMLVCVPEETTTMCNDGAGVWHPIKTTREPYIGMVFSLDVDTHHTYIADGIVTHNCVQTSAKISDDDRFKFHGNDFYLKSSQEMRRLFEDVPGACDNTLLIAERADVQIEFGRDLTPAFPVPEGFASEDDYLRHLVLEGAQKKWTLTEEVVNRLHYELDVITSMGFSGYFLIIWDLVQHARKVGIRLGPGRGSAGGCAIAYALDVIEIDPLKWNLLFERFLNPERVSMPDIDLDFDSRYRDHMINYVSQKYGSDRVAQIITFTQIKSRQAVRDAARVMGLPFSDGDRVAKALPPLTFGRDTPIEACLTLDPKHAQGYEQAFRFRELYNVDPTAKSVIDIAKGLEGLRKSDGMHAGAVVIAPSPLTDYTPIQKKTDKPLTTQYEMHGIEELGLLKMDFLAVKNLDSLTDAVRWVKERHGIELDLMGLPLDDPGVYEMLGEGDTTAVFQLESPDMKALLRSLAPQNFEDIAAVIALYRPGPLAANMHVDYADRRNGRASVEVFHPDARDLLSETYGLMVFQEQLMTVAQKFAGYSLGEGYQLVKTCAKKLPEAMEQERERFVSGVAERYGEELGEQLFDTVSEFSNYAFNKSHSYGYAYIAYQTAYLKRYYPVEYMSAVLNTVQTDHARLSKYLAHARQIGLEVRSPDINKSTHEFRPISDTCIVFGLAGVKGIGDEPARDIANERNNGDYSSFFDYLNRAPKRCINKKVLETLIMTGAFDSLGHDRKGLMQVMPGALKTQLKDRKTETMGDVRLFEIEPEVHTQDVPNLGFSSEELLRMEKDLLGVYVSGHPLDNLTDVLDECTTHNIEWINELEEGDQAPRHVVIAGLITSAVERVTRKGDLMMNFTLEDLTGSINCVAFPEQYGRHLAILEEDNVIAINAELKPGRGAMDAILRSAELLQKPQQRSGRAHVAIPLGYPEETVMRAARAAPGLAPLVVHSGLTVREESVTVDIDKLKDALSKEEGHEQEAR